MCMLSESTIHVFSLRCISGTQNAKKIWWYHFFPSHKQIYLFWRNFVRSNNACLNAPHELGWWNDLWLVSFLELLITKCTSRISPIAFSHARVNKFFCNRCLRWQIISNIMILSSITYWQKFLRKHTVGLVAIVAPQLDGTFFSNHNLHIYKFLCWFSYRNLTWITWSVDG